jgi:formate-dependent nitrite reductase membrane component NrfD
MQIIHWNYVITFYLFAAGMSAGALLIALVAEIVDYDKYRHIVRIGSLISPFPITFGIVCLVFDLERPYYFWKLLTTIQYTSVMSIGSWILVFFCCISYTNFYLRIKGDRLKAIIKILGLILSLGVALYTGILISILNARPLWNSPFIPILFFISAIIDGNAVICIGLYLIKKDVITEIIFRQNKIFLYLIDVSMLSILIISMIFFVSGVSTKDSSSAVSVILTGAYSVYFWIFVIFTGVIIPLIYELAEVIKYSSNKTTSRQNNINAAIAIGVMALFGGYMLRYVIIYGGQITSAIKY